MNRQTHFAQRAKHLIFRGAGTNRSWTVRIEALSSGARVLETKLELRLSAECLDPLPLEERDRASNGFNARKCQSYQFDTNRSRNW